MSAAAAPALAGKRVNFIFSERAYADLAGIADSTHRSMTEVVRLGIALVKIAMEASRNGHKLVVTNQEGLPIKEIVLPE